MASQISAANWRPFIPDKTAFLLPPPSNEWLGMVQGSELVRWNNLQAQAEEVLGFGFGQEVAIEPPRTDVKMLYNGAPGLFEPYAVYSATVLS